MERVWIGLGSNVGDRRAHLEGALDALRRHPSISVERVSSFIETEPVGGPTQGPFLNGAAELRTMLKPAALLEVLLDVERRGGRLRQQRWGPRTIDLDILIWEGRVVSSPGLKIPHPRMAERAFVLGPLAQIAPELVHPVLGRRIRELHHGVAIHAGR
jgi:2-amino-4-hydroxy-6-hydroxymethyldihydropteridine diphosphokinase